MSLVADVIAGLRCERCKTRLHVDPQIAIETSDRTIKAQGICQHGARQVSCDLPQNVSIEHTTTCPRCQERLLLAGTGFVDREAFEFGFVCQRCELTLRRAGCKTCLPQQPGGKMLTLADA